MNPEIARHADSSSDSERRLVGAAFAQFERISTHAKIARPDSLRSFLVPGYRILGELHRGGQGVVYQVIQESTHRKMAIKVLKEGPFADRVELARFEREVDVLSRLNHPHIVAIHDRGLTAGHAYYVMDYIAGKPLDAYVAGADLSVKQLLDLFIKVCDAVNVAHLRGVIHRDLKPGNILIDDDGQPRILDFGLAKLAQDAAEASWAHGMTLTGQFVGSLPWSSPEQASGRSDQIDIRTDVYTLGVILYQLLTGRFPYPVTGRVDDVVRHIAQTPAARPTTLRAIDRDLELIVLKSLAKEPERRYQSAGELAGDIRLYLTNQPVSASAPSAGYRLRKLVRRNRGLVLAGTVIAATMVVATGVSVTFGLSEARQRRLADDARIHAQKAESEAKTRANELDQVATFQKNQFAEIDPKRMGTQLHLDLLKKARAAAEHSRLTRAEVDSRVAELETLIAGSDFTGLALDALEDNFFHPALTAIEEKFSDQPLVKAKLLQTVASTLQALGLFDDATAPQEEALAIRRRLLGGEHTDTLQSISNMASLLEGQGKPADAEPYRREAMATYRRVLGDEHPYTLASINNMGAVLEAQGKLVEAEPYLRQAMEVRRRVLGEDDPQTLNSIDNMGHLLQARGKLTEAEGFRREALAGFRRVLGNEHPDTLASMNNLGSLLQASGKLAAAEELWREALTGYRRVLGDEHPNTLTAINNMGFLLQAENKLPEAEVFLREALEKRRKVLGEEHPLTLTSITNMGALFYAQAKWADAEVYFREALQKYRRVMGDDHADTLTAISSLGFVLQAEGKLSDAEEKLREVLDIRRRVLGDEHPDTLYSIRILADLLTSQGKPAQAVALMVPAEQGARRAFTGSIAVRLGRWVIVLGRARAAAGDFNAAETNLIEAQAIFEVAGGATDQDRTSVWSGLANLYDAWHSAEPEKGYDAKAAEWRAKLKSMSHR